MACNGIDDGQIYEMFIVGGVLSKVRYNSFSPTRGLIPKQERMTNNVGFTVLRYLLNSTASSAFLFSTMCEIRDRLAISSVQPPA